MRLLLALPLILAGLLCGTEGSYQTMKAKGRLMCGDVPAANVRVRVMDEDNGPDPDDTMDEGTTNSEGYFNLEGGTSELTSIDPELQIFHDCNDFMTPGGSIQKPCQRQFIFGIPDKYINKQEPFDLGTLNLEILIPKEEESKCLP